MNSATLVFAMSDQIHLVGPGRCRQAIQPQIWATGRPSSSMPGAPKGAPQHGRSGGARTPNPRFWRPVLYQLSYTPNLVPLTPLRGTEAPSLQRCEGAGKY